MVSGGLLGGVLGRLGDLFAASWGVLGASWGVLGASWGRLGASWAVLEASWTVLAASWPQKTLNINPPAFRPMRRATTFSLARFSTEVSYPAEPPYIQRSAPDKYRKSASRHPPAVRSRAAARHPPPDLPLSKDIYPAEPTCTQRSARDKIAKALPVIRQPPRRCARPPPFCSRSSVLM